MKLKERGLGTGAIVGIVVVVIVIVAVVVAAVFLLGGAGGPGGISVPSGFSKTGEMSVEGYTVTIYTGSGTENSALDSFKTAFQNAGWTYMGDYSASGYSGAGFEKGTNIAVVSAAVAGNQVVVTVLVGPKTT